MEEKRKLNFEALYDAFTSDHERALGLFYDQQRRNFMTWAKSRFSVDDDALLDVYQDAIIVLYNRVIKRKTDEIKATPESYLFGIARNLLLKKSNTLKKTVQTDNVFQFVPEAGETELLDKYENDHNKAIVDKALSKLDVSCRNIIELFYYRQYKLEVIVESLGYENKDVVKSRKYQCMKKLRSIMASIKY